MIAAVSTGVARCRPRGLISGAAVNVATGFAAGLAADFAAVFAAGAALVGLSFVLPVLAVPLAFAVAVFAGRAFVAAAFVVAAFVAALLVAEAFVLVAFGAITAEAGASLLSLYGFGSSPCAVVRGERGPRPCEGRRGSVMSSMCYVVTGHGSVRNHRRARRTQRVTPLRTIVTLRATQSGSMRRRDTVTMKTIWSGTTRGTAKRHSRLRRDVAPTILDRRHQPRRNPHTAIGQGIQAGGRSATPTSDARARGRDPRGLAGLPALKRLSQSIVTGWRQRKPSRPTPHKSSPDFPGRNAACTLGYRPRFPA